MGDGLGATKTRLFGKKSGGTPNPQVKKVGVTPNPDQIFASAAALAAEAGRGNLPKNVEFSAESKKKTKKWEFWKVKKKCQKLRIFICETGFF